jgi:hypothetical protein
VTTDKPIGPDETPEEPEEIGGLLRDVFDLAEQVAAAVSDEQVEQRLAELLGRDVDHDEESWATPYLSDINWVQVTDTTYSVTEASRTPYPSWVHLRHSYRGLKDYVDEQLDRASEIKANAQAEAATIVEEARKEAAQILEDARRLAPLEGSVRNDGADMCGTPIFEAMRSQRRWLEEHQPSLLDPPNGPTIFIGGRHRRSDDRCDAGTGRPTQPASGASRASDHYAARPS